MKRVAIYCRVSTDMVQSLRSLENQILAYIDTVQNHPDWELRGIYADRGISGTSIRHRTSFQRLLRHCEAGKIDLIVTKSISRFSRNTHDLLGTLRQLRRLRVDVLFEKEGIRMSETGNEMVMTMYAAVAQQEAVNISQNVSWAYKNRALQGNPRFRRLYGYRVVGRGKNQMLEPVPEEVAVVQRVFADFTSGRAIMEIAHRLSKAGIPTVQSRSTWTGKAIRNMLLNVKYTGNTKVLKTLSKLAELHTNLTDPQTQSEEIFIRNSHPAIIDQQTYDAAQHLLQQRALPEDKRIQAVQSRKAHPVPLTGRIQCGHCGDYYVFYRKRRGHDGRAGARIYTCTTHLNHRASCPAHQVLDTDVLALLKRAVRQRYEPDGPQAVTNIQAQLLAACNLDLAEEERLQRMIDIARTGQSLLISPGDTNLRQKKEHLEQAFNQFERNLQVSERDFEARMQLHQALQTNPPLEDLLKTLTLPQAFALIPSIVLHTPEDALIHWLDLQQTELGCCQPSPSPHQVAPDSTTTPHPSAGTLDASATDPATPTAHRAVLPANEKAVHARNTLAMGLVLPAKSGIGNNKLRVCAYCRTSTAEELQTRSLIRQIATYTHAIMTHPDYVFGGIYADDGKSGLSTTGRSGFQQMIKDAKVGKFDLILTKSVSRFSRNVVDVLATVRMLKALPHPVTVLFETESIRTDSTQGDLMLTLHAAVAQGEAEATSENVRWAKRKSVLNGTFRHPGAMPYGYTKAADNSWLINPEHAVIVRRIFCEYLQGKTAYIIAKELTKDHIPTAQGNDAWDPMIVRRMLASMVYTGDYLYGKRYRPSLASPRRVPNNGELEQLLIEEHHPTIISKETWEKAQAITRNRPQPQQNLTFRDIQTEEMNMADDAIKSRLVCGQCGRSAHFHAVMRSTKNNSSYGYWKCNGKLSRNMSNRCRLPAFRKELMEHALMIAFQHMKHHGDWQDSWSGYFNECTQFEQDTNNTIQHLMEQQADLYHGIHSLVDTEENESVQFVDRIADLTEKILHINADMDKLVHVKKSIAYDRDRLKHFPDLLKTLQTFEPEAERIQFRRALCEHSVQSIHMLSKGTIRIDFIFDHSETIAIKGYFPHKLPMK